MPSEAIALYTSIFPDSRINKTTYYGKGGMNFTRCPKALS